MAMAPADGQGGSHLAPGGHGETKERSATASTSRKVAPLPSTLIDKPHHEQLGSPLGQGSLYVPSKQLSTFFSCHKPAAQGDKPSKRPALSFQSTTVSPFSQFPPHRGLRSVMESGSILPLSMQLHSILPTKTLESPKRLPAVSVSNHTSESLGHYPVMEEWL